MKVKVWEVIKAIKACKDSPFSFIIGFIHGFIMAARKQNSDHKKQGNVE